MGDTPVEVALHVRAQHAEGPLWDAATGSLVVGGRHGRTCALLRSDVEQRQLVEHERSARWHGARRGRRPDRRETGGPEGLAVLDRSLGTMQLRVPIEKDKPENRANDVKVDRRGRVWVGTMAFEKRPRNAALYRVDVDKASCVVDGLTISDGPAFDEAADRLYLADTSRGACRPSTSAMP